MKDEVLDEIICFGKGELVNGSPVFCRNTTCVPQAKKFCHYNHHLDIKAAVQNGFIPIKAWKTIRKELPKVDHTQQLKLNASCTNGNLEVHNAEKIRRIQLRAKNSYMAVTPNSSEITVEIPTRLILSDQKIEVTVWDFYENTNKTTIACSAKLLILNVVQSNISSLSVT
uniref:Uncharacterized protein n=1 Tax=Panagrolaimus superbus TaxID=310955 RepID=A0A914YQ45_9BILA